MRLTPLRSFVPFLLAAAAMLPAQGVKWWTDDFDGARIAAEKERGEMVMLYFWRKDHNACTSMFGGTMADPTVVAELSKYVCMGAEAETDIGTPLFEKYNVQNVPTVVFVKPNGDIVDLIEGYSPADEFRQELERVASGKGTIAGLRQAIADDPKDFESGASLVTKLRAIGDADGAMKVVDAMIALDPKGRNEHVAEAMLLKLFQETMKPGTPNTDWDLEPLRKFLAQQRNKRVKFLGYDQMARIEYGRDNLKEAAKLASKAWKDIPDDEVLSFGQRMQDIIYQRQDDLDKIDKSIIKLGVKISKETLEAAEKAVKKTPDNAWLAGVYSRHAGVMYAATKRKDAFELIEKALELDPKNEAYKAFRDIWRKGGK